MPPLTLRSRSFTRVLFTAIPLLDFDFTGFVFDHCAFVDLDLAGSCLKNVVFKVCIWLCRSAISFAVIVFSDYALDLLFCVISPFIR